MLACRHALDVTGAPEPSDVQYENMEHGGFDRFLRAALVAACSYSALAVGFVLISLASAMRYNLPQVCVCVCAALSINRPTRRLLTAASQAKQSWNVMPSALGTAVLAAAVSLRPCL